MRIGLISDTHGQLRSEVFDSFQGVDLILHAGDIGGVELLTELESIASVIAVYGNTDGFDIRAEVPRVAKVELAGRKVTIVHGDEFGSPKPAGLRAAYPDADIIVYGHTHRPLVDWSGGKLVVNPGAAGPRRFELRPSVGIMTLGEPADSRPGIEIIEI